MYVDYVRRSRSSSCRLLCPINCQTYITLHRNEVGWWGKRGACKYHASNAAVEGKKEGRKDRWKEGREEESASAILTLMVDTVACVMLAWFGDTEKRRQVGTAELKPPRPLPSSDEHNVPLYDTDFLSNDSGAVRSTLRGSTRCALMTSLAVVCLIRR